ncbi:hypothetical protein [Streptomyces huasconensis]|uniref:hypothetical protein n=1 Tax=Streptomyces TaxID=1883 RepID=UPI001E41E712
MDRLQPLLRNWMARDGTWRTPGVTTAEVRVGTLLSALGAGVGQADTHPPARHLLSSRPGPPWRRAVPSSSPGRCPRRRSPRWPGRC